MQRKPQHRISGGLGPVGFCICPKCGHKEPHKRGLPCREQLCPNCNSSMLRDEGRCLESRERKHPAGTNE